MPRVDAFDKAAGRAMYAADLCVKNALVAKVLHAPHAHALVKSIDTADALKIEGVESVFTSLTYLRTISPPPGIPGQRRLSTRT